MKLNVLLLSLAILAASNCGLRAQATPTSATIQPNGPVPTPYAIVKQDANSRIWQREVFETGVNGKIITHHQSYTELASGLNYKDANGNWQPAREEIDILPDGTAAATQGQHQVHFPIDIYNGAIELTTPDGIQLKSQPVGLSYYDGSNVVFIAELTNSVGQLINSNQLIYPNAFSGLKADLLYTYKKAGLEQDIILRQQPPLPDTFGLDTAASRLQVVTEFLNPPTPGVNISSVPKQAGIALSDEELSFGAMRMIPGKAFVLRTGSPKAMVGKSWMTIQGRHFLVEEVPLMALANDLDSLTASTQKRGLKLWARGSYRDLVFPRHHETKQFSRIMKMAAAKSKPMAGVVLDYVAVTTQTNYVFRCDTTYYISGSLNLFGTTTFEGGSVIKYSPGSQIQLIPSPTNPIVNWFNGPYRPVIFTASDDNSAGDEISGSSGSPSGYYANPALSFAAPPSQAISYIRMEFAQQAISIPGNAFTIDDSQFIYCQSCINLLQSTVHLRNALFANNQTNFVNPSYSTGTVDAQNVTFSGCGWLASTNSAYSSTTFAATNCVFANVTNLSAGITSLTGQNNGFYNDIPFGYTATTSLIYPFQNVGAGDYYLQSGCAFKNTGTTNIDDDLLADIAAATTYPPLIYSNVMLSVSTTLTPQAQRDNTGMPDLGYHYNPIDYIADRFSISNAVLTLADAVAVANYNEDGIIIGDGSRLNCSGSVLFPNILTSYQTVQEQPIILGGNSNPPYDGCNVIPSYTYAAPTAQVDFTRFTCLGGEGYHLEDFGSLESFRTLSAQDCEFWGGQINCGDFASNTVTYNNNLFSRATMSVSTAISSAVALTNNLFWGSSSVILRQAQGTFIYAYNNDFDSSIVKPYAVNCTNGFNAYLNCTGQLNPTNATDIFSANGLNYQSGFLGVFYQPASSPLIEMGNTNANLVGLYHFTTQTNQTVEGTNIVTIGYHYVATDAYGNPLDTNGDGIPDYLEDANGNGLVDSGEIGWNLTNDLGLQVIISRPVSNGSTP